jgi:hypothetical protein
MSNTAASPFVPPSEIPSSPHATSPPQQHEEPSIADSHLTATSRVAIRQQQSEDNDGDDQDNDNSDDDDGGDDDCDTSTSVSASDASDDRSHADDDADHGAAATARPQRKLDAKLIAAQKAKADEALVHAFVRQRCVMPTQLNTTIAPTPGPQLRAAFQAWCVAQGAGARNNGSSLGRNTFYELLRLATNGQTKDSRSVKRRFNGLGLLAGQAAASSGVAPSSGGPIAPTTPATTPSSHAAAPIVTTPQLRPSYIKLGRRHRRLDKLNSRLVHKVESRDELLRRLDKSVQRELRGAESAVRLSLEIELQRRFTAGHLDLVVDSATGRVNVELTALKFVFDCSDESAGLTKQRARLRYSVALAMRHAGHVQTGEHRIVLDDNATLAALAITTRLPDDEPHDRALTSVLHRIRLGLGLGESRDKPQFAHLQYNGVVVLVSYESPATVEPRVSIAASLWLTQLCWADLEFDAIEVHYNENETPMQRAFRDNVGGAFQPVTMQRIRDEAAAAVSKVPSTGATTKDDHRELQRRQRWLTSVEQWPAKLDSPTTIASIFQSLGANKDVVPPRLKASVEQLLRAAKPLVQLQKRLVQACADFSSTVVDVFAQMTNVAATGTEEDERKLAAALLAMASANAPPVADNLAACKRWANSVLDTFLEQDQGAPLRLP